MQRSVLPKRIAKKVFAQLSSTLITFGVIASAPFVLVSCSDKNQPNIELVQDMMVTPALKSQRLDETAPNQIGNRLPPENTVAVGAHPYPYKVAEMEKAAKELKNPMAGDLSSETLMVGQKFYETNCMICHGMKGEGGDSTSVAKMMPLKPPSLFSDKIKSWNDAEIYHLITMGRGLMGPYASHIPQQYRWQVVNYIRHLQKESK